MLEIPTELSVFEAILSRRSVRNFSARPVALQTIDTLLEAAVRAPSGLDAQPWAFLIIQDAGRLRMLSDRAKPLFLAEVRRMGLLSPNEVMEDLRKPESNLFYNAETLIIICGQSLGPSVVADCWLAAENLMLAATALGLGTCVIGSVVSALNVAAVKRELGIPESYTVFAPIILGYPQEPATPLTPRRKPLILAHLTSETVASTV